MLPLTSCVSHSSPPSPAVSLPLSRYSSHLFSPPLLTASLSFILSLTLRAFYVSHRLTHKKIASPSLVVSLTHSLVVPPSLPPRMRWASLTLDWFLSHMSVTRSLCTDSHTRCLSHCCVFSFSLSSLSRVLSHSFSRLLLHAFSLVDSFSRSHSLVVVVTHSRCVSLTRRLSHSYVVSLTHRLARFVSDSRSLSKLRDSLSCVSCSMTYLSCVGYSVSCLSYIAFEQVIYIR